MKEQVNRAIAALKAFDDAILDLQHEALKNGTPESRIALQLIEDNNANTVMLLASMRPETGNPTWTAKWFFTLRER